MVSSSRDVFDGLRGRDGPAGDLIQGRSESFSVFLAGGWGHNSHDHRGRWICKAPSRKVCGVSDTEAVQVSMAERLATPPPPSPLRLLRKFFLLLGPWRVAE